MDWRKFFGKETHENDEKDILFEGNLFQLHGNMKHSERKVVFAQFDKAEKGVLFATDIASRGLDFNKVTHVLQFDLNGQLTEYGNRIGRTARLNAKGFSLSFITENREEKYVEFLDNNGARQTKKNRFKLL